ncbi:hypothetical protein EJO66_25570 [Variovorax beijingensis]|uniref:Glycosyl hydrolase family 43 n=1 Tax=Variovorax beijingensis TaxID=2496117 RepID=A0ABY0A013_9BURK|nr:hypothetical protein [Variovorax beijingensis]RSZ30802.1 hypothetical protein EJO66_25570 [Variovorax beijingensis]
MMRAQRCLSQPLIHAGLDASLGNNINGPSLIRVPDWLPNPLGRYYLYFAHHQGQHIRLAYADDLMGPWTIRAPGVLPVADSSCSDHVASPDVHVDHAVRKIRMYFHGVAFAAGQTDGHETQFGEAARWIGNQRSKLAISDDGLHFSAQPRVLGASYFRVFEWQGRQHALAMPGAFYREDERGGFELGPVPFEPSFRHCAVRVVGPLLHVYFSRVGDTPERILHTTVDLRSDWTAWRHGDVTTLLQPERVWEGAAMPGAPSRRGPVFELVQQLRDPAVFVDEGKEYLLYAAGGEQAIGLARLPSTVCTGTSL